MFSSSHARLVEVGVGAGVNFPYFKNAGVNEADMDFKVSCTQQLCCTVCIVARVAAIFMRSTFSHVASFVCVLIHVRL